MIRTHLTSRGLRWLAAGAATLAMASAHAAPFANDDEWHFSITPYLWLPNVNGSLRYSLPSGSGGTAGSEVGPNNYLDSLKFAMMLSGEARRNEWAVLADMIYLDFGKQDSHVTSVGGGGSGISIPRERNTGTNQDLKGFTWTLAGSYTAARTETASFDVLAGVRMLRLKASLNWNLDASIPGTGYTFARSGTVQNEETLLDAVIGVRGRVWFGEDKWFVPYYLDIGGGDSSMTYQALAGVGYAFHWGELQLSYRELSWQQSGDKMVQKLRFSGPALGVSWRF